MKRIVTLIASAAFVCTTLSAKVVKDFTSTSDNVLTFTVDSIDYRPDLTRVYGRVQGRPHTSARIDEVQYVGNSASWKATDIDGVDFRRYFQWEDEGEIPLEIDFPATKPDAGVQLLFTTARGQSTTTAKKIATKKRK
ncbi:MAG: hypothetical protein K2G41_01175 [Duncaniella sp.]|uniref:hypothetical protein n=1 Tax=Duncaniella sp. TaxID=2518496 RepID=UPI0023C18B2D|nr:hypothetical protein [Duncaniella sp.]MDE6089289.1 hypothetical protein [Duncaniella sp.]